MPDRTCAKGPVTASSRAVTLSSARVPLNHPHEELRGHVPEQSNETHPAPAVRGPPNAGQATDGHIVDIEEIVDRAADLRAPPSSRVKPFRCGRRPASPRDIDDVTTWSGAIAGPAIGTTSPPLCLSPPKPTMMTESANMRTTRPSRLPTLETYVAVPLSDIRRRSNGQAGSCRLESEA